VEVTFSQPRVVISSETGRRDGTSLHTRFERFELSKGLGTSGDVESLVDGDDLLLLGLVYYWFVAMTTVAITTLSLSGFCARVALSSLPVASRLSWR